MIRITQIEHHLVRTRQWDTNGWHGLIHYKSIKISHTLFKGRAWIADENIIWVRVCFFIPRTGYPGCRGTGFMQIIDFYKTKSSPQGLPTLDKILLMM